MPIPTIDLDTRRYPDLVDEARSLIPRYSPEWTNENASDPGITLLELFAYLTEQLIYRANRIPERYRRKFLSLVGFDPAPPRPAHTILAVQPASGGDGLQLLAGLAFRSTGVEFRTATPLTLTATALGAVQAFDGTSFADATALARAGSPFAPFGDDPTGDPSADAGAQPTLYLGFDGAIPAGRELALYVKVADPPPVDGTGPHHSLRLAWEVRDGTAWHALDPDQGEVEDDTRSLTQDGPLILRPPVDVGTAALGAVPAGLRYVRCRLASGEPDTTPLLRGIAVNAVAARQAAPHTQTFTIAAETPAPAAAPAAGGEAALNLALDDTGTIVSFAAAGDPASPVLVIAYTAATASTDGHLTLACGQVGRGTGEPGGALEMPGAPVANAGVTLWSLEQDGAHEWSAEVDLDAAGRADAVFTVDAEYGIVRFGDGLYGRAVPAGAPLLAAYDVTSAAAGNVPAASDWTLARADDALNAALLGGDPAGTRALISAITSPFPASGGAEAETVAAAAGRAAARLWAHERLVDVAADSGKTTLDEMNRDAVLALAAPPRATTLLDFERLALEVPGARIARARAFGGIDGDHPGLNAPGTVTVVIVAGVPRSRPEPGAGLLAAVRGFLGGLKTVGTRLVVAAPLYVEIDVTAALAVLPAASAARVQDDARKRIAAYLDPLSGGPAGRGRPFGRDVYRSEILDLLDRVNGVDHVVSLDLSGPDGGGCGNVCVPATGLAVSGTTTVEVAT